MIKYFKDRYKKYKIAKTSVELYIFEDDTCSYRYSKFPEDIRTMLKEIKLDDYVILSYIPDGFWYRETYLFPKKYILDYEIKNNTILSKQLEEYKEKMLEDRMKEVIGL